MADTRNDIYPTTEAANNQTCESKQESPHKIVVMKVNSNESCGKEDKNSDSEPAKSCSPSSRTFPPSKSDNPVLSSSRFGSSFGSKSFVLRQSAFGASKFGSTSPTSSCLVTSPKHVVLRPSQLAVGSPDSQTSLHQATTLSNASESRISNPFARVPCLSEDFSEDTLSKKPDVQSKPEGENISDAENECVVQKPDILSTDIPISTATISPAKEILSAPKFVPLGTPVAQKDECSSSSGISTGATTSSATGFIFGQNLHERVEVAKTEAPINSTKNSVGTSSSSSPSSATAANGTSEMLFSSVIRKELTSDGSSSSSSNENVDRPKSLSEAAREYEEARAVKRKYEEVAVVTGEEDEANVLQLNCKLFAFDKATGTWVERGRGNLRLNDKEGPDGMQSRVVIRTTGSLRVVLNTKIWAGMVVDRASAKSVRLTAMDNSGQIKVFLVMASPKEAEQLHQALRVRVTREQQANSDASEEPTRKRPSLLQDAGGGSEPKI